MASASTRAALGRRAVHTRKWLEYWAGRLEDEIANQNIELYRRGGKFSDNDPVTLTLPRWELRNLIEGMRERIDEIRRFSN